MPTSNVRKSDLSTSHAAAQSITYAAPGIEQDILDLLGDYPTGLTIQQISDISGINLVTVSPRIKPLRLREQVHSVGKRQNPSGRMAHVWTLGAGRVSVPAPTPVQKTTPAWLNDNAAFLRAAADLLEVLDRLSIKE